MAKILICDDGNEALNLTAEIIMEFYQEIGGEYTLLRFSSPSEVIAFVQSGNAVDVAFLDIMMPGMNGIDLAFRLREIGFGGYLIFLTSFNDFAAQSYSVKAFSYLLKPVEKEAVWEQLDIIEKTLLMGDNRGFSLTRRSGMRFVLFSELMYVEVVNHSLSFHLTDGENINIYATLREFSEMLLAEPQMVKPQKSFIVNLDHVNSCENRALFMRDGTRVSVPKDFEVVKAKWLERMFGGEDW